MSNNHHNMMRLLCSGTSMRYKQNTNPSSESIGEISNNEKASGENINIRKRYKINVKGFDIPEPIAEFKNMKSSYPKILKSILRNLTEHGINNPSPIQMQCIPLLMENRSVLCCAPTGSGKTLAFIVPLLSHLKQSAEGGARALIISPTRELAQQTVRESKLFGGTHKFAYHLISKCSAKSDFLSKESTKKDVLISTPNYLLQMLKENKLDLSNLQFCVLDEADSLFDVQFKEDISHILEYINLTKVTVGLFSATLANGIDSWCFKYLDNFVQVFIGAANRANANIKQSLQFVGTEDSKIYSIRMIIQKGFEPPMLIFTQTKDRAKQLFGELKLVSTKIGCIHSDLSQQLREEAINNFRSGKTWILICTDLMGRGIDFKNVNCVVNFDLPQTKVDYIHRIGRTGRAGRTGQAITLFTEADKAILPSIINVLKNSGCELPDWLKNLKGLARRDYKKATRKPVQRKDISTVPKYDIIKAKKRKLMIKDSKDKKKAKLTEEGGKKSENSTKL